MESQNPSLLYSLVHWFIAAIALLITSWVMPGFKVSSLGAALWAAVIIGLANIFVWPILIILTLPINILTLGLFTFVVNGIVLKMCAALIKGFDIKGWPSAIFGAIILSIVSWLLHGIFV